MGSDSGIEWTDATWNPTIGCAKVSPGCKHCYAEVMHRRLAEMGSEKYAEPFSVVRSWEPHLEEPVTVEATETRLRKLDVRPLPRGRYSRLLAPGV